MPRKYFRKFLPSHSSIRDHRHLSRLGTFLHHPNLWHLNRRSVAGGVAVGMFSGLIPGPIQMLAAALISIPLRVNLPVAMAATWYTNPFTIGPLYFAAYEIGKRLTGERGIANPHPEFDFSNIVQWAQAFGHWVLSLGKPLAIGLLVLAIALSALGWAAVWFGWRWHVGYVWQRRCAQRSLQKVRLNKPGEALQQPIRPE
jgi:uncharacterized protein (DUF2062 family)